MGPSEMLLYQGGYFFFVNTGWKIPILILAGFLVVGRVELSDALYFGI
ncbi:hypothetical protein DCCM_0401 [Desulfocucumis palustris]|uniref:Uncharacterized protein n=1 Tax=Desulfocucumis palustris TaxID=1898651 RepID=A0A2L2X862_9FIRM|nr:hypothetical protein DCCM_0401 [Desulfocucumis palustris]